MEYNINSVLGRFIFSGVVICKSSQI